MRILPGDYRLESGIISENAKAKQVAARFQKYLVHRKFVDWKVYDGDERYWALYKNGRIVCMLGLNIPERTIYNPTIQVAWTSPTYRRLGLYTYLFNQAVQWLRLNRPKTLAIDSGYHVANKESAAMQKKQGRQVTSIDHDYVETTYRI